MKGVNKIQLSPLAVKEAFALYFTKMLSSECIGMEVSSYECEKIPGNSEEHITVTIRKQENSDGKK